MSDMYSCTAQPSCNAMIAFFCLPLNGHHLNPDGVQYAAAAFEPPHASVQHGSDLILPDRGCMFTVLLTIGNNRSTTLRSERARCGIHCCLSFLICLVLFLNLLSECMNPFMKVGKTVQQNSQ